MGCRETGTLFFAFISANFFGLFSCKSQVPHEHWDSEGDQNSRNQVSINKSAR